MDDRSNATIYRFHEFTHEAYRDTLQGIRDQRQFCQYHEFDFADTSVLWRHDVDFSLAAAADLARIEHELGVVATYFVHLQSEFYNAFDARCRTHLDSILSAGHEFGIHFDCSYHDIADQAALEDRLQTEQGIIAFLTGQTPRAFSFHNPTPEILHYDNDRYAGMINTYGKSLKEGTVYASDSNGLWRHKSIPDTIREHPDKPLQILTHPAWWTAEVKSPAEKIRDCVAERATTTQSRYDSALAQHERMNIDW